MSFYRVMPSKFTVVAFAAVLFSIFSAPAPAVDKTFTPYVGYRVGGEFKDFTTGNRLKLGESDSYGFAFGWGEQDKYEVFYSEQASSLSATSRVSSSVLFDVDVINIMFTGKNTLNEEIGSYLSGMVGLTRFDPERSGLSSETRLALGAGAGIDYPLGKRLALRLEGRGVATFLDTDSGVFCSSNNGCLVVTDSDVMWQFEIVSGLTFRF